MAGRSVLGVFREVDEAVEAADKLKENGMDNFEVLSGTPFPEGAFGEKVANHRLYVWPLMGAMLGFSLALLVTAGTQLAYPLVTGGKPILALPAMFIIAYEGTMLGAIISTIIGVIFESRLPKAKLDLYDPRITEGYIGLVVVAPEGEAERVDALFKAANAADVQLEPAS
ncbi:MAG: DUF3341 domain-containing protein [Chloroflexota bacterium]|nr:DUF3341 domain-containing protein [Chloroflexota bacterium]MDE2969795.1 DUF3341 domain-containing protein [Chloroflexota bacterium]